MELSIDVARVPDSPLLALRVEVDGRGLLPRPLRGVDPDWVLPPLSGALLPSGGGRSVMIGTCCEPGCGSFSVHVRRSAERVQWAPDPAPLDRTLTDTLDFPLLAYLDAIDAAASHPRLHERGRRLARALELQLVRQHDKYDSPSGRAVTVPMAWQTGDGYVNLRFQGRLHAVPLDELPDDDPEAVVQLQLLATNPLRLPPAED